MTEAAIRASSALRPARSRSIAAKVSRRPGSTAVVAALIGRNNKAGMSGDPEVSRRLGDRQEISDLLFHYCRSLDLNDREGVVAVFTEDCVVELYDGPDGVTRGREEMRSRLPQRYSHLAATSHHLSNIQIDFESSARARAVSYLYAWHRFADSSEGEIWGRYHGVLERTEDGWRISRRRLCVAGQRNFDRRWFPMERRS